MRFPTFHKWRGIEFHGLISRSIRTPAMFNIVPPIFYCTVHKYVDCNKFRFYINSPRPDRLTVTFNRRFFAIIEQNYLHSKHKLETRRSHLSAVESFDTI